jgi:hypothetical protein
MTNRAKQTDALFKRPFRLSLLHVVRRVMLGLLIMQVLTATVLLVIAALGKWGKHETSFPHVPFEEVQVGENHLQFIASPDVV